MKPRLLDLFCGAGGAAMGYHRAGFEVVGVDITPQPNYPFKFHLADAMASLTFPLDGFDAIHASPPCQHAARVTAWRGNRSNHENLIPATRERLIAVGLPYVIENVPEAELHASFVLCGSMFGLPIRRHRHFETNWTDGGLLDLEPCRHRPSDLAFEHKGERAYTDAMGCEWMTNLEGRQAIPPTMTEHIGHQLMQVLNAERASA